MRTTAMLVPRGAPILVLNGLAKPISDVSSILGELRSCGSGVGQFRDPATRARLHKRWGNRVVPTAALHEDAA